MNSKKIVSMIGAAVVAASMALSSLPVCAAVTTMPDGGKFDAAYYAATYPDVVAALGTDANALYQHYKTCGAKEGRQPYATGTTAAPASTTSGLTASEKATAKKILNNYLSGKNDWDGIYATCSMVKKRNAELAPNPVFAIMDLNGDGVAELYVDSDNGNGYNGMAVYLLANGRSASQIYQYSPTLNSYLSFGTDWQHLTAYVNDGAMSVLFILAVDPETGVQSLTNNAGATAVISDAEADAYISSFTTIANYLTFQPLTKANVNAIK